MVHGKFVSSQLLHPDEVLLHANLGLLAACMHGQRPPKSVEVFSQSVVDTSIGWMNIGYFDDGFALHVLATFYRSALVLLTMYSCSEEDNRSCFDHGMP